MSTCATTQDEADALLLEFRPPQGYWNVGGYLWLTDHCSRLVEFAHGRIEELSTPTHEHQMVLLRLFRLLDAFLAPRHGVISVAPHRVRVGAARFREPDVLLLLHEADERRDNRYWSGADLVVEVVSPDDPDRDYITKRADYAEAGIPEYWIVDPQAAAITVLTLTGDAYAEHGEFHPGDIATSALLPDFTADVTKVLEGS